MHKKRYIQIGIIVLLFIIFWGVYRYCYVNSPKGGLTMFDVNSSKTLLITEEKEVVLTGGNRDSLLKILKSNLKEIDKINVEKIDFDIMIDFCNGNVGYLSTEKSVFKIEGGYYLLSEEEHRRILMMLEAER